VRPVLFHIDTVAIPSFWVTAFLGFFVAFLWARSDVVRRGYDVDLAYDLALCTYVGGWVGARVFLIPSGWGYFTQDPIAFLLSGSGWVWYGGVVGGALAVWLLARRRKLSFLLLADVLAPALAIGLAIGRLGCQLAGDGDYGVPTDLPWGMSYPNGVVPTTERVHPAPIYEMLGCLLIFAYLWRRRRVDPPLGDLFGRYLILSAGVRFVIEFVRRNPRWLIGLTTAQWMSVGLMAIGVLLLRHARWLSIQASPSSRRPEHQPPSGCSLSRSDVELSSP
jgi:phosphatidylglycerol:prolipoprotein diacylglycerol transferase